MGDRNVDCLLGDHGYSWSIAPMTDTSLIPTAALARVVSWFSCGAASAVATKIAVNQYGADHVTPAYCETGSEHPDNARFFDDVEKWVGVKIERLRSERYTSTWEVFEKRRYLAGVEGALCTIELKIIPRLAFQRPNDIHIFGYTADRSDTDRAQRLRANYPELTIITPLIERGLTKESCLAMIEKAGIALPPLYALGFHNNNCIPCVKATSPAYWALVRKTFPGEFERMAKLSRALDVRLCRVNGDRAFIDEIPMNQPTTNPIQPSCDFLCHIANSEIEP
jgi:3'-phosphoadenosine 5'-phosphosulfate sulfotransferase (PAPS reductase)/FAD synthetase